MSGLQKMQSPPKSLPLNTGSFCLTCTSHPLGKMGRAGLVVGAIRFSQPALTEQRKGNLPR